MQAVVAPAPEPLPSSPQRPQVIVVTTALLVFISFWRAAAIVLCDLASTAYYIGGIVEQAIGKAAPWFIGAVMLFCYAVRARLRRVVRDVRARRRVPRRQGGDGRHARQALGLGPDVRLRPDRTDQRRVGRPVHRRPDQRAAPRRARCRSRIAPDCGSRGHRRSRSRSTSGARTSSASRSRATRR